MGYDPDKLSEMEKEPVDLLEKFSIIRVTNMLRYDGYIPVLIGF